MAVSLLEVGGDQKLMCDLESHNLQLHTNITSQYVTLLIVGINFRTEWLS